MDTTTDDDAMNITADEATSSDGKVAASAVATDPSSMSMKRDSFNGVWKLDKSKEDWSMRGYLETLQVNELAIQAHEKGELEHETFHTITTTSTTAPSPGTDSLQHNKIKIVKRSRVNNDLVVELTVGEENVEYLQPGQRPKKSLATTEDFLKTHVQIQSSLLAMNGLLAYVTDIKRLVQEPDKTVLVQELTIINDESKASNTTTRYFLPFNGSMDLE